MKFANITKTVKMEEFIFFLSEKTIFSEDPVNL